MKKYLPIDAADIMAAIADKAIAKSKEKYNE